MELDFRRTYEEVTFSIITPTLNAESFILNCLKSVRDQNSCAEHLIQDSASSDRTIPIVKEFANQATSVSFESLPDAGQSDALNKLVSKATGKYIGWLNADETYLPGTLAAISEIFENTNADIIYGDCFFVNQSHRIIRLLSNHRFNSTMLEQYGCYIPSCATFFRKEVLKSISFDTKLRRAMDWDIYLSLRNQYRFKYIKKTLSTFTVHDKQITNRPESADIEEFRYLARKHSLQYVPAESKPRFNYKLLRIILKTLNFNYLREVYFLSIARIGNHKYSALGNNNEI